MCHVLMGIYRIRLGIMYTLYDDRTYWLRRDCLGGLHFGINIDTGSLLSYVKPPALMLAELIHELP